MRLALQFIMAIFALSILSVIEGTSVFAASSPVDFVLPVETKRMSYSLALVYRDNTVTLLPMEREVKRATVSPDGFRIAYVVRDGDYFKVYIGSTDGKNKKLAEEYRSDQRNFQDFVDVRFIKNGKYLLISRFIKNQLSFVEYGISSGKPRFIKKTDWQGAPTTIYRTDTYNNGCLVFTRTNNIGNRLIQQVWSAGAYKGTYSLFLEIEAPPSIIDMVPDLGHKRIFVAGTPTRHVSGRNTIKNLMLITSAKEDPKKLTEDTAFINLTISNDGESVAWQSSSYVNGLKFKRYNVKTSKVVEISPPGSEKKEEKQSVGTIVPSK